ncbi:MAG: IS1 family transposase [Chloroflexi bacterium]|nr:MAG: IS1 family transposase [Chloroflexota bacterium]
MFISEKSRTLGYLSQSERCVNTLANGTLAVVSKPQMIITMHSMKKQCPYCQTYTHQVKAGRNPSGSQRYLCKQCQRIYTPTPRRNGYAPDMREKARQLRQEGLSYRAIARQLNVGTQTVINWVNTPPPPNKSNQNPASSTSSHTRKKEMYNGTRPGN